MKTLFLSLLLASIGQSFGAAVVIDSITRTVTTQTNGETTNTTTTTATGAFLESSQSGGGDQTTAEAHQGTSLSNDSTFTFSKQGEYSVAGQRTGLNFAPVTIASESLVDVTFTLPAQADYWVSGAYAVTGSEGSGSPQVSWSLAPTTISGSTGFSGLATSGSQGFQSVGTLEPGQYQLKFRAGLGSEGSIFPQFIDTNSSSSASFTGLNLVVSPQLVAPIPEPSALVLLGLAGCFIWGRRRRA